MATAIRNSKDLSHLKNLDDVRAEITAVKARIKLHEERLQEAKKELPREALQTVLGRAVPVLLTRGVVVKAFGVIKNTFGLISRIKSSGKGNVKEGLLNSVKRVGVVTALKAAFNLIKNRKR